MVRGLCITCPVPEILKSIESGESTYTDSLRRNDEETNRLLIACVAKVASFGVCETGPEFTPENGEETSVTCGHSQSVDFDTLAEILLQEEGICITGLPVRREQ